MWMRMSWKDVRVICHYLGILVMFSSFIMLVPLLVALLCKEWEIAPNYLIGIGVSLSVGSALRLVRIAPGQLNRQNALIVTGLAWIVLSLIATVPLSMSGHFSSWLDVFFECVSGYTTTGASIVRDLNHLSNADNMFRLMMHAVGGVGVIVIALSLGLLNKGANSLYNSEARTDHIVPNVMETAQFIVKFSTIIIIATALVLTALCFIAGMPLHRSAFHSLLLSISAFITGGFTPTPLSIQYYHSFPLEVVLMVVMFLGSLSFVLFAGALRGRVKAFFSDLEVRTMFLWLVVITCVLAASLSITATFSDLPAMLRRGLFIIVSAFSTTGFQTVTGNQLLTAFSSGAFMVVAMLMAMGGSTGGTSGGIKFLRLGIILKSLLLSIKQTIAPDSARMVVTYHHMGRRVLTPEVTSAAMTIFVLYVLSYITGALLGIAYGYDASEALFESVAMASNGGITCGIVTPGMPAGLELFYILQMWAGRLEFLTLFALVVKIVYSLIPTRHKVKPLRHLFDDEEE